MWIGSPLSSMVIVTFAALHCPPTVLASLQLLTGETLSTLPTLIPAIRTCESGFRPLADWKIACTVYGLANGLANLVYAP